LAKLTELACDSKREKLVHSIIFEKLSFFECVLCFQKDSFWSEFCQRYFPLIIDHLILPVMERYSDVFSAKPLLLRLLIHYDRLFRVSPKQSFYFRYSNPLFASAAFAAQSSAPLLSKIMEKMHCFYCDIRLIKAFPKKSLLEEFPFILYYILISEQFYEMEFSTIFSQGCLLNTLTKIAELFNVRLSGEHSVDEPSTIDIQRFHSLLLPLVWNVGDYQIATNGKLLPSSLLLRSTKALKVLSILFYSKDWNYSGGSVVSRRKPSRESSKSADWTKLSRNYLSLMLKTEFLYITSNLLQHDWNTQNVFCQMRCLFSLASVIELFSTLDLIQFLPKVRIFSAFPFFLFVASEFRF
jgi:hypothetical protein